MARYGRDFGMNTGNRGRDRNRNFNEMGGGYGTGYGYIRGYDVEGGYGYAGQTARFGGGRARSQNRSGGYDRGFGDRLRGGWNDLKHGARRMMHRGGYDRGYGGR
jgi:hypothetical protein